MLISKLINKIKDKKELATYYGCKYLWMNNAGGYECLKNVQHACIDNENNKRYLYEK